MKVPCPALPLLLAKAGPLAPVPPFPTGLARGAKWTLPFSSCTFSKPKVRTFDEKLIQKTVEYKDFNFVLF